MKAFYKQHQGFEHLSQPVYIPSHSTQPPYIQNKQSIISSSHVPTFKQPSLKSNCQNSYRNQQLNSNTYYTFNNDKENRSGNRTANLYEIDDTSTKKYPNNKYFQFNDQDSSGRKYLKQKLNLYEDQQTGKKQHGYENQNYNVGEEQFKRIKSYRNVEEDNYTIDKKGLRTLGKREGSNLVNLSMDAAKNHKKQSYLENEYILSTNNNESQNIYNNSKRANQQKNIKSSKSSQRQKIKAKKGSASVSASISTIQSKQRSRLKDKDKDKDKVKAKNKMNKNSGRNIDENIQQSLGELKLYKKLCFDMRKKNSMLTKQLQQCKEENRKSIHELQRKVQKISEKYVQKKQYVDQTKTQKIMESLKVIKGKLDKKQKQSDKVSKKFYEFFIESLGILLPQGAQRNVKFSSLQIQIIWKHMLQFLISNDYKIDSFAKAKTLG